MQASIRHIRQMLVFRWKDEFILKNAPVIKRSFFVCWNGREETMSAVDLYPPRLRLKVKKMKNSARAQVAGRRSRMGGSITGSPKAAREEVLFSFRRGRRRIRSLWAGLARATFLRGHMICCVLFQLCVVRCRVVPARAGAVALRRWQRGVKAHYTDGPPRYSTFWVTFSLLRGRARTGRHRLSIL